MCFKSPIPLSLIHIYGNKIAYVSKWNIYVEDLNTGLLKQLTKDGGKNICLLYTSRCV